MKPTSMPERTPAMTAKGTGIPALMQRHATTPAKAIVDPTDRSKPPETRSTVIPAATMASIDRPSSMASRFEELRKIGVTRLIASPPSTMIRIRISSLIASSLVRALLLESNCSLDPAASLTPHLQQLLALPFRQRFSSTPVAYAIIFSSVASAFFRIFRILPSLTTTMRSLSTSTSSKSDEIAMIPIPESASRLKRS